MWIGYYEVQTVTMENKGSSSIFQMPLTKRKTWNISRYELWPLRTVYNSIFHRSSTNRSTQWNQLCKPEKKSANLIKNVGTSLSAVYIGFVERNISRKLKADMTKSCKTKVINERVKIIIVQILGSPVSVGIGLV